MLNTPNEKIKPNWKVQEEKLIASLKKQPFVVVLRLSKNHFKETLQQKILFSNLSLLTTNQIKHIEIGWHPHPGWMDLCNHIKTTFPEINLGAASITSEEALNIIIKSDISYAMSPLWNRDLFQKAIKLNQLLIPGIKTNNEFKQAVSMGYKVIKIFPAYKLGINFISEIKSKSKSKSFIIAAGGLQVKDIKIWRSKGYGAIALGRELFIQKNLDRSLINLLKMQQA